MIDGLAEVAKKVPGPIFVLHPNEWPGRAFVGEIGSVDSAGWDLQLTYLDQLETPSCGLAVVSLHYADSVREEVFFPDLFGGFIMRFVTSESLTSGRDAFTSQEHFVVQRSAVQWNFTEHDGVHFRHIALPLEIIQLDLGTGKSTVVVAGWNYKIRSIVSKLMIVNKPYGV